MDKSAASGVSSDGASCHQTGMGQHTGCGATLPASDCSGDVCGGGLSMVGRRFEVPEGRDEAFLAEWGAAKAFMERQPGYIATRLHRSLVPNARFRFINVAEWASVEDFQAALNYPAFIKLRDATPFPHFPALYEVMRTSPR